MGFTMLPYCIAVDVDYITGGWDDEIVDGSSCSCTNCSAGAGGIFTRFGDERFSSK